MSNSIENLNIVVQESAHNYVDIKYGDPVCATVGISSVQGPAGPSGSDGEQGPAGLLKSPYTAAELSVSGALQTYIDSCLSNGERCILPPGTITIDNTILITKVNGGGLYGAGAPYASSQSGSGWNNVGVYFATRIKYSGTGPAIEIKGAHGFVVEDLGVECDGIGILYSHIAGWGSSGNWFSRLSFLGCDVGFKAGENLGEHNCADITFAGCSFNRCNTGFLTKHIQALNYVFLQCAFFYCIDTDINLEAGGKIDVIGCLTFATNVFLKIGYGGRTAMPCIINGLRMDRSPPSGDVIPIVVDARDAVTNVEVIVNGLAINSLSHEATTRQIAYLPQYNNTGFRIEFNSVSHSILYADPPGPYGNQIYYSELNEFKAFGSANLISRNHVVSDTIESKNAIGGHLIGEGSGIPVGFNDMYKSFYTLISGSSSNPAVSGPLLRILGNSFVTRDISLADHTGWDSTSGRFSCGVEIFDDGVDNVRSGDHTFDSTTFSYFPIGVSIGQLGSGPNSAINSHNNTFTGCMFFNCARAVQVHSNNSVGNSFSNCVFENEADTSGKVFDIKSGGNLFLSNVRNKSLGTFLSISDPLSYGNDSTITISGGVSDASVSGYKFIDMEYVNKSIVGNLTVSIDGFQAIQGSGSSSWGVGSNKRFASIAGKTRFVWRGARMTGEVVSSCLVGHSSVILGNIFVPTFIFDDGVLPPDPRDLLVTSECTHAGLAASAGQGVVNLFWSSCVDGDGNPISDGRWQWDGQSSQWVDYGQIQTFVI